MGISDGSRGEEPGEKVCDKRQQQQQQQHNNNNNNNDTKHRYEHVPKPVETTQGGKVTILWNQPVRTDRTIPNNKPDIIMRDNEKRTCILIDVAI